MTNESTEQNKAFIFGIKTFAFTLIIEFIILRYTAKYFIKDISFILLSFILFLPIILGVLGYIFKKYKGSPIKENN